MSAQLAVTRRGINIHSYGIINTIMAKRVIDSLPLRLRCECPVPSCEEIIEIILAQRRELRRQYPRGFIVIASHAASSQSKVIFKSDAYHVVEMAEFTQTVTDL
ncbi:MAG: hypothetical protein NVSMB39_4270 [Candidatus Saccharimonadales bacterium]